MLTQQEVHTIEKLIGDGLWTQVIEIAQEKIKQSSEESKVWLFLGIARTETSNFNDAIRCLETALKLGEDDARLFFYMARCLDEQKKPLLADSFYEKASLIDKKTKKYYIYRVVNLFNNKLFDEIKTIVPKIIHEVKDFDIFPMILMESYYNTADNHSEIPREVLEQCNRFALKNGDINSLAKYIDFLYSYQKIAEIKNFYHFMEEQKNEKISPVILYGKGKFSELLGDFDSAERYYEHGYQKESASTFNLCALIDLFFVNNKIAEAVSYIEKEFQKAKNKKDLLFLVKASFVYSKILDKQNDAIKIAREGLKNFPNNMELHLNSCFPLLFLSNFKEGWLSYRMREGNLLKRSFDVQVWSPDEILGTNEKLMVWSEQGVGDHILFGSCLKDLSETVNPESIIFETDPRLLSLLQRSFPEINIRKNPRIKRDGSTYQTDYHKHIPLGTLPSFFRKTIDTYPGTSFLKTDPEWDTIWKKRLDKTKINIGIMWRSGDINRIREKFYLGVNDLKGLLVDNKKINWINLQYECKEDELYFIADQCGIALSQWDDVDLKDDFEAVTSLIKHLDLVITPSTAIHALAGAVNTRTWMFCPHPTWTTYGQNYYPWFNSIRLYQVPFPDSMKYTVPYMRKDLDQWLATGEPPPNKSQVIITDIIEAEKLLEQYSTDVKSEMLSELTSETLLVTGKEIAHVQEKTASLRLKKKLSLFKEKDFFSISKDNSLTEFSTAGIDFDINLCLQEANNNANTLILIFTGNSSERIPLTFGLPYLKQNFEGHSLIEALGETCSYIQVRDVWQMWHQVGPLGSCLLNPEKAADKWLELIMPKIEQSKAEKIICIGTSAGASAAIQFGAKLHADAVVAISPQARPLDGEWELENGGFSFLEEGGNWRKQVRDKFNLSPVDLKPYANELGDKLHIIVPKLNKIDITHADYLTQDNPNIQRYRSTGKNHGEVNNELFFDIIKKLI